MKRHRIHANLFPIKVLGSSAVALAAALSAPALAQEKEAPYWASIRDSATEMNTRVGPSPEYKIAWVYRRPGLPVKVLRLKDGWRLIEDPDGAQGWVVARLLSPDRSAYVVGEGLADMRSEPSARCRTQMAGRAGRFRQTRLVQRRLVPLRSRRQPRLHRSGAPVGNGRALT